jgi:hypothetical protein
MGIENRELVERARSIFRPLLDGSVRGELRLQPRFGSSSPTAKSPRLAVAEGSPTSTRTRAATGRSLRALSRAFWRKILADTGCALDLASPSLDGDVEVAAYESLGLAVVDIAQWVVLMRCLEMQGVLLSWSSNDVN